MKVLLIGATGTFGSRCVPALLAHKHQVVVFVRSETKLRDLFPNPVLSEISIVTGNATDSSAIEDALVRNKCDAFINSAGAAAIFPGQAPRMQEIINAVATAGVAASKKLNYPIRAWLMGGLSALDVPGKPGTMLMRYFPMFPEHALTYACLSAKPQEDLKWSLLCPSQMKPSQTIETLSKPRENPLIASADFPPGWQDSYFHNVPIIGLLFSILGNAPRYAINLDDCADFIASDLENPESEFIGHRVGLYDSGKGKVE